MLNPEFGSLNMFVRNKEEAASILYYAVIMKGDPSLVLMTTTLRPMFLKKDEVILSGTVIDWRNAYKTCKDEQFLEKCYDFLKRETEIFKIKKGETGWRVLTSS